MASAAPVQLQRELVESRCHTGFMEFSSTRFAFCSLNAGDGKSCTPFLSCSLPYCGEPLGLLRLVPALGEQEDFSIGPLSRIEVDGRSDVFQRETSLDVGLKLRGEEFLDAAGQKQFCEKPLSLNPSGKPEPFEFFVPEYEILGRLREPGRPPVCPPASVPSTRRRKR